MYAQQLLWWRHRQIFAWDGTKWPETLSKKLDLRPSMHYLNLHWKAHHLVKVAAAAAIEVCQQLLAHASSDTAYSKTAAGTVYKIPCMDNRSLSLQLKMTPTFLLGEEYMIMRRQHVSEKEPRRPAICSVSNV
jgi:hypothetical protein